MYILYVSQLWTDFNSKSVQLAEIRVSYTNQSTQRQKVLHSKAIYDAILLGWNSETIEYIEEAKIILLNRANEILGVYELSKGVFQKQL
jgi:DNA repair protein RadC